MRTIFIGPLGGGKIPNNGVSIRNSYSINVLKKYIKDLKIFDTEFNRKNPIFLIKLILLILFNPKAKFIIATNGKSADKLIKIILTYNHNANIVYWVVGGNIVNRFKSGKYKIKKYKKISNLMVQGKRLKEGLEQLNFNNVTVTSNFKILPKVNLNEKSKKDHINFIFLSRIIPEKGCDLIFEAVKSLNNKGFEDKFNVDFYGPISDDYCESFQSQVFKLKNVNYKGFLDLKDIGNYNILQDYDMMLFPTYWYGEGCPGAVIDAYIAGLPILASDWNLNGDYIEDGITGFLIEPKNSKALENIMEEILLEKKDLKSLSRNAKLKSYEFDIDNVLSKENLKKYKLI